MKQAVKEHEFTWFFIIVTGVGVIMALASVAAIIAAIVLAFRNFG